MDVEEVELGKLFARLTHSCAQTRLTAREEIQAWPFETVLKLLARHWPQGYDLPRPEPATRWERWQRRWSPPETHRLLFTLLDRL